MKIRTDVTDINYVAYGAKKPSPAAAPVSRNNNPASNTIDPQLVQSITSRLNTERNLSEALSIAQASQALLQKAMIISSQLRSIASQAVVQGRVNSSELEVALSDINSTFGTYNRGVTGPVQAFVQAKTEVPALPGIDDTIGDVVTMGNSMARGEVPGLPVVDNAIEGISRRMELYSRSIGDYSRMLRENVAPPVTGDAGMAAVGNAITARPGVALAAQGNINSEGVYRILS